MTCNKHTNGNEKSNEILLTFKLNETSTKVEDKLLKWLFSCLDEIGEKVKDEVQQYGWHIISNVYYNDYLEEEVGDNEEKKNTIVVAIHLAGPDNMGFNSDGLTMPYNNEPPNTLVPTDITGCLQNEPHYITDIGVSTVSSATMMNWWEEMISVEPDRFDIPGLGYMRHRMWMKFIDVGWSSVREQSFNFGWNGYRPE